MSSNSNAKFRNEYAVEHGREPATALQSAVSAARTIPRPPPASIDLAALEASYLLHPEMVRRILEIFLESYHDAPRRLRALASTGELGRIGALAQSLRSVLGFVEAGRQADLAAYTEQAARLCDPAAAELAERLADEVEALFEDVQRLLERFDEA